MKVIFIVVKVMIYLVYFFMIKNCYEVVRLWFYKFDFIGNVILFLSDIILFICFGGFNM